MLCPLHLHFDVPSNVSPAGQRCQPSPHEPAYCIMCDSSSPFRLSVVVFLTPKKSLLHPSALHPTAFFFIPSLALFSHSFIHPYPSISPTSPPAYLAFFLCFSLLHIKTHHFTEKKSKRHGATSHTSPLSGATNNPQQYSFPRGVVWSSNLRRHHHSHLAIHVGRFYSLLSSCRTSIQKLGRSVCVCECVKNETSEKNGHAQFLRPPLAQRSGSLLNENGRERTRTRE